MARIVWDSAGSRRYEFGVDRGVLYDLEGNGIPWNGLIRASGATNIEKEALFFNGQKYADVFNYGEYTGLIAAYTYPDNFLPLTGVEEIGAGFYVFDQTPKPFHMSYRSLIGNDIDGQEHGYKIHVLYNIIATPTDISHDTVGDTTEANELQWSITGVPVELAGFAPTCHVVFDSLRCAPATLDTIEDILYGTDAYPSTLPPAEYFLYLFELSGSTS